MTIGICVWHVNPDNIVYVGPYTLETARTAIESFGFTHYPAQPGEEESWQADGGIGGSEGVVLSIEDRGDVAIEKRFAFSPDQLVKTVRDPD